MQQLNFVISQMKRAQITDYEEDRKRLKSEKLEETTIFQLPIDIYRELISFIDERSSRNLRMCCKFIKEIMDKSFFHIIPQLSIQDVDELKEKIPILLKSVTSDNVIGLDLANSWIDYKVMQAIPPGIHVLCLQRCAIQVKKPQGYHISMYVST